MSTRYLGYLSLYSFCLVFCSAVIAGNVTIEVKVPNYSQERFASAKFTLSDGSDWACPRGETCRLTLEDGWKGAISFKRDTQWVFRGFRGSLADAMEWDPETNKPYIYINTTSGLGGELNSEEVYYLEPILYGPSTVISDMRHTLGAEADIKFDLRANITHECALPSINHGAQLFVSADFNLDGIKDPFIFYNCAYPGTESVHPFYYVGPEHYVLVMLSQPDGTFINGNKILFGSEKVLTGYFGFVGYEMEDNAKDLNGDGYPEFVFHTWRDNIWHTSCGLHYSDPDYSSCNELTEEESARYRWDQLYNQEGRFASEPPGFPFSTRGILLSKEDGTYSAEILAVGQDSEPGPISVAKDSKGYWTIWIMGPTFLEDQRDEVAQDWIAASGWDEPLPDGTVLPKPGPKVYRFIGKDLVDVTDAYFTSIVDDEGKQCIYETSLEERWEQKLLDAGRSLSECSTFGDPRFNSTFYTSFQYIPLESDSSKTVSWTGVTQGTFLQRICPEQNGQICAASNDLDESYGQRYRVPAMRTWELEHDYGWIETTRHIADNEMTVIPVPRGLFFKLSDQQERWGYTVMDRPNGDIRAYKAIPNLPRDFATFTCCHNATYLDAGIEPEDLGDVMFNVPNFEADWTPENCPTYFYTVDAEHCETENGWLDIEPSEIYEGAPDNLVRLWMEAECGGSEEAGYDECVSSQRNGYRYDAIKAGFDHRTMQFKSGVAIWSSHDPLKWIGMNSMYYPVFSDINGDGFADFLANRAQWFPDFYSDRQRAGHDRPALVVGLNNRAWHFKETNAYWGSYTAHNALSAEAMEAAQLKNRLSNYYMGNLVRDINGDGLADVIVFDKDQRGLDQNGMPEVYIAFGEIVDLKKK